MKILVVNLLRLGDILMSTPVTKGLRGMYPNAEIHLLINEQFKGLIPLVPHVDRVHLFERNELQGSIGLSDRPLFEAMDRLDNLVQNLSSEKFDRIINLTQNRLSGWICGLIDAKDKSGLVISDRGQASFGSPWFRYLNDYVAAGGREIFHFSDIFIYGSGLEAAKSRIFAQESATGKNEAEKLMEGVEDYILIQPLTSDEKKNWNSNSLASALRNFQIVHPTVKVFLMGAPFEEEALKNIKNSCDAVGVELEIAICTFEGAFSLLKKSKLLLTCDTSIKHLASATNCPVIELCLGSSDYRKTGIYKDKSLIIKAKEYCSPCPHDGKCFRQTHVCSEAIPPELVSLAMSEMYRGNYSQLPILASEFSEETELFITHFSPAGFWFPIPLTSKMEPWLMDRLIERSTWKMTLQKEYLKPIGQYGDEGRRIKSSVEELLPEIKTSEWKHFLAQLETDTLSLDKQVHRAMQSLKRFIKNSGDTIAKGELSEELENLCEGMKETPSLISMLNISGQKEIDLAQIRKVQGYLEDAFHRTQIKLKIIRSIRTQVMENL